MSQFTGCWAGQAAEHVTSFPTLNLTSQTNETQRFTHKTQTDDPSKQNELWLTEAQRPVMSSGLSCTRQMEGIEME